MPQQNRVQPDGTFLAHSGRGAFMGNRGILHDKSGRLTKARWRHKAWVCCVLEFKNRHRKIMQPGAYTELFFHDEAVALAAGHRPCGECRRGDFNHFLVCAGHAGKIEEFDKRLHAARAIPRIFEQVRHSAEVKDLPDGTFFLGEETTPMLKWDGEYHLYFPDGYKANLTKKPAGKVTVLTPLPTLKALANGFKPVVRF